jgi:glycosyltransferase involved in cell wall biosynthesis
MQVTTSSPAAAPVADGAAFAGKVLFVQHGTFSGTNASVRAALARLAPELELEIVDTKANLKSWRLLIVLFGLLSEFGPGLFVSKRRFRFHLLRSHAFWREVRRLVRRAAAAGGPYSFTFQTQSLFDASLAGVPHGLYTDFAARGTRWTGWHGELEPTASWLALEEGLYRGADRVFTFGSRVRDLIVEDYGAEPGRVVRAGGGPNVATCAEPARREPRHVLFVGVEWERKGGPELLRAFAEVRTRLPDATLTIVGCAPAVAQPGVRVAGRQPPARMIEYFQRAACFCMPSRLEPFGVVYVEALHAGLPIIASDCGDQADMVRDGENGFIVPTGDVAALARRLYEVLSDPERARAMGEASLARAPAFSWDAVAATILREMRRGGADAPAARA